MLISMQKKRFSFQPLYLKVTVTFICIWLFLAHNGERTVWERSRNGQKILVTLRERPGKERERCRNEIITVLK